ncbi:hypothetical protein BKA66DRAFT_444506 [Pyrenochaeta sp. MPI-SDFR-AT-0127]|nr:hypothetical protein BKA66DRAFT_444506 [Pyrenochaeta sp. MPI-SDFR-AT-0127]
MNVSRARKALGIPTPRAILSLLLRNLLATFASPTPAAVISAQPPETFSINPGENKQRNLNLLVSLVDTGLVPKVSDAVLVAKAGLLELPLFSVEVVAVAVGIAFCKLLPSNRQYPL